MHKNASVVTVYILQQLIWSNITAMSTVSMLVSYVHPLQSTCWCQQASVWTCSLRKQPVAMQPIYHCNCRVDPNANLLNTAKSKRDHRRMWQGHSYFVHNLKSPPSHHSVKTNNKGTLPMSFLTLASGIQSICLEKYSIKTENQHWWWIF